MFNEIMAIKESLDSHGISVQDMNSDIQYHNLLKPCPKGLPSFRLSINNEGQVSNMEEFNVSENMMYFFESNQANGLTFKYCTAKTGLEKRVTSHLSCTIRLFESLNQEDERLIPLKILVERLRKVNINNFISDINNRLVQFSKYNPEKGCYLCLDIHNWMKDANGNQVQSLDLIEAISDGLYKNEELITITGNKDVYGNPVEGSDDVHKFALSLPAAGFAKFQLFSKNEANDCFERFGMNGNQSFPVGTKTAQMVASIMKGICSEANRNKLFYRYTSPNDNKILVITSMLPKDAIIEGKGVEYETKKGKLTQNLNINKWMIESSNLLKSLKEQVQTKQTKCSIALFSIPSNGAIQVKYFKNIDSNVVYEKTQQWVNGIAETSRYIPKGVFIPPNVETLVKLMNKKWKLAGNSVEEIKDKSDEYTLNDAYDFFLDQKEAITNLTNRIVKKYCKYILRCYCGNKESLESKPYSLNLMIPTLGLVLYKNGFNKEKIMETISFKIGRLMNVANEIHRLYFTTRGRSIPPELIGDRYIQQIRKQPSQVREIVSKFYLEFEKYLLPLRNKGNDNDKSKIKIKTYFKIINSISTGLCDETVKELNSPIGLIQLTYGFVFRFPKKVEISADKA